MRLHEVTTTPLTFRIENHGFHHGQSDQRLVALRDGQYVGHIDFSVYQDEPHVQYISVPAERRQGIGTAMVHRLQAEFPNTEINMGGLTPDGSKLLGSIPQITIPNADYEAEAQRLQQLQAREAEYQRMADAFHASPTPEARQQLLAITQDWNDLSDQIYQIEDNIRERRPHKRLFR